MIRRSVEIDGMRRDHRKFNSEISCRSLSSADSVFSVFSVFSVKSPRTTSTPLKGEKPHAN